MARKIEYADLESMTHEELVYWAMRPMELIANCGDARAYAQLATVVASEVRDSVPAESPISGEVIGYELRGTTKDGRVITVGRLLDGRGQLAETQALYRAGEDLLRRVVAQR